MPKSRDSRKAGLSDIQNNMFFNQNA